MAKLIRRILTVGGNFKMPRDTEARGKTETTLQAIKNVMDSINVSIEEAMDILKIDPLKRQDYASRIK
jgi:hypothetical protein